MKTKLVAYLLASMVATLSVAVLAQNITSQGSSAKLPIDVRIPRGMQGKVSATSIRANAVGAARIASSSHGQNSVTTRNFPPGSIYLGDTLPFWTFDIKGSRDGDHHQGVIVGHDPFRHPGTDRIQTVIVPLIFHTHRVATGIDPTTLVMTTAPGDTVSDPTKADKVCIAGTTNVPLTLFQQSPIFNAVPFKFNGINVGTTQYNDAFQRAEFWNVLGEARNFYHVLLQPVTTINPIVVDVPDTAGVAITDPNFFVSDFGFSICAPMLLVDANWFDSYLNGTITPELQEAGIVTPANFPIFMSYNTPFPVGDVTNLFNCCAGGYHSVTGEPILDQTYAVTDFDTTNFFVGPPTGLTTEVASHEVGEWMNDPFGTNETAPWGNTGQVVGCQANLEVGDPLTGSDVAPVTMPNGFTYPLQELAYFSWFYGSPSFGTAGLFSNNGSFKSDAGPNCF